MRLTERRTMPRCAPLHGCPRPPVRTSPPFMSGVSRWFGNSRLGSSRPAGVHSSGWSAHGRMPRNRDVDGLSRVPVRTMTQRDGLLLFGAAATVAIFIWDLLTPLGMAVGLWYVPVVVLTLWLPFRRAAALAALLFSLLIVLGYQYGPSGPGDAFAPFNRLVSVVALWVVALLCESWKGTSRTAAALDDQLQAVFANASVGIAITDGQGRFVRTNEAYGALTGFAQEELRDRTFMDVAHQDDLARHADMVGRLTRGECRGGTLETRLIRKSGAVIWVRNNVALLRDAPDRPTHILAVTEDITERKTAEQERSRLFERVQASERRLQALSRQLFETQEAERRHLARELHDEIGQILSTLKILIQRAQRTGERSAAVDCLEESIRIVEQAIRQIRALSLDLRPSVLDDLGLVPALRWFVEVKARQGAFAGVFESEPFAVRLPLEVELACFRVVQEAVSNVMRHGKATKVMVALSRGPRGLEVSVRDDGVGFDVTAALADAVRGRSLGLLGMQERVALVGGTLAIDSMKGKGCEVKAWFPLSEGAGSRRSGDAS